MPIALGELDLDEVLRYMGTPPSQAGPELRAGRMRRRPAPLGLEGL